MADTPLILSLARIATAALAGTISLVGFRAFTRTRKRNVLLLAVGTGILAAGYLIEGLLVEVLEWSISDATALESVMTLVAAAVLVASVYLRDARHGRPRRLNRAGDREEDDHPAAGPPKPRDAARTVPASER